LTQHRRKIRLKNYIFALTTLDDLTTSPG